MPINPNLIGRDVDLDDRVGDHPGQSRRGIIKWARSHNAATPVEVWRDGVTNRRFRVDSTTDGTGLLVFWAVANTVTSANCQSWFGHQGFIMNGGAFSVMTNGVITEMPTAGTMTLALTADDTNKSVLFTWTPNAEAATIVINAFWTTTNDLGIGYLT